MWIPLCKFAPCSNLIQRAIEKYDFEEGTDFDIFVKPNNNQKDFIGIVTDSKSGKRDYIVTMDMAKELCMV